MVHNQIQKNIINPQTTNQKQNRHPTKQKSRTEDHDINPKPQKKPKMTTVIQENVETGVGERCEGVGRRNE